MSFQNMKENHRLQLALKIYIIEQKNEGWEFFKRPKKTCCDKNIVIYVATKFVGVSFSSQAKSLVHHLNHWDIAS